MYLIMMFVFLITIVVSLYVKYYHSLSFVKDTQLHLL